MAFLLRIPLHLYRWIISPLLHALCGGGCGCRFHPSCSAYGLEALNTHGACRGLMMTLRRVVRCHPWSEGGLDPVPLIGNPNLEKGDFNSVNQFP